LSDDDLAPSQDEWWQPPPKTFHIELHVAAALYHYVVRRDRVLQRMLTDD
jgi:cytochrome b561